MNTIRSSVASLGLRYDMLESDHYLTPYVDLVLLGEKELHISFVSGSENNFVIQSDEAYKLYELLANARNEPILLGAQSEFYTFCIHHKILIEEMSVMGGNQEAHCLLNFVPYRLYEDMYLFRIGKRIYNFFASTDEEVVSRIKFITTAIQNANDKKVLQLLLEDTLSLKINSAPVLVPTKLLSNKNLLQCANKVNCYFYIAKLSALDLILDVFCLSDILQLANDQDDYWDKIIDFGITEQIIVDIVQGDVSISDVDSYQRFGARVSVRTESLSLEDSQYCYGVGVTAKEAIGKAVMEGVERFYAQHAPTQYVISTEDELIENHKNTIGFQNFLHLLDDQLKLLAEPLKTDNQLLFNWAKVQDIRGEDHYVPLDVCVYNSNISHQHDILSLIGNTNGYSAHVDKQQAIMSSVRECIERDALLLWWYRKKSPPQISQDTLPENVKDLLRADQLNEYDIRILDVTLDSLPVVLIVARNTMSKSPYFFCSAACAVSYEKAISKAMDEFMIIFSSYKTREDSKRIDLKDIKFPRDHGTFYLDPKNKDEVDFLFLGEVSHSISMKQEVDLSLELLEKKIGDIYIYEAFEYISDKIEINVIKAIMPHLIPISFGYKLDPFDHPRLRQYKIDGDEVSYDPSNLLKNYAPHFFS